MIDEELLMMSIDKFKNKLYTGNTLDSFALEVVDCIVDLINKQPKVGEWISVKDRLPDEFELVLIQNRHGVMNVASRVRDKWFNFQGFKLLEAIAYMPLPNPYQEVQDEK